MGVESDADRAVFVNPTDFGKIATYRGDALNVLFPETLPAYAAVSLGAQVAVEGSRPWVECRTSDLPDDAAHGDELSVNDTDYVVAEIHADGAGDEGFTILVLEQQ